MSAVEPGRAVPPEPNLVLEVTVGGRERRSGGIMLSIFDERMGECSVTLRECPLLRREDVAEALRILAHRLDTSVTPEVRS
jgi:hypothetical protein